MKKYISILIVLAALFSLTSCDSSTAVSDGVYRAEYDSYDESGYKDFVEITFKD